MSIWWILLSRLRKHSVFHLFIPLFGGIFWEWFIDAFVTEDSFIVSVLGRFWFRSAVLVSGVFLSWLIVMVVLINRETKKRVNRRALVKLQDTLDKATSYYGVSIIPLTEWFDPAVQLYWTKLVKRKMEAEEFEHERTLLFFSNREYKNSQVEKVDENHYGKCLAFMHGDCEIPLSFLERKDIFEILDDLSPEVRQALGCYPRWTRLGPLRVFQRLPLSLLRRRINQLDFALVTKQGKKKPSALRICKRGEDVLIDEELKEDKAEPYRLLVEKIKAKVYDEEEKKLRTEKDFLTDFGYPSQIRSKQDREAARRRRQEGYRKIKFDRLVAKTEGQFKIRKCSRVETIADKSGDVDVRIEYEAIVASPRDEVRQKLPMNFTSKSGFFCEPKITRAEGTSVDWQWEEADSNDNRLGFVVFDPPVVNDPVGFTMEMHNHNGIHFNRRDRQDASGSSEECVRITTRNQYELYVLKVRFPERHFPGQFKIKVLDDSKQRDYQEEKLATSRFAAFDDEGIAVLILEKPLPSYTYEITWNLPKDDIDGLGLSGHVARIVRETARRLLALRSDPDQTRLTAVRKNLEELKDQIASASIGPQMIDDPNLEVILHAYSEADGGLVLVTSNTAVPENLIRVGRGTVGQAYRRRALVSWILDPDSDDSSYWDYGSGHTGIVSIPLLYPLDSGGRTCVLSISTTSRNSNFLGLIEKLADRDIRRTLTQHVNAWYAKTLASALGLPDLSKRRHTSEAAEEK